MNIVKQKQDKMIKALKLAVMFMPENELDFTIS